VVVVVVVVVLLLLLLLVSVDFERRKTMLKVSWGAIIINFLS
jgi:hypothetical protein